MAHGFQHLKIGDRVTRLLAGTIPQPLRVVEVREDRIVCGGGWEFDRETGAEIDDDLGWGPHFTGSYLRRAE